MLSGLGVTAGAQRLWAHKGYKTKLPLRKFLCTLQTMAGQVDLSSLMSITNYILF
jgi:stearoyl-coenzyme A desaturase